MTVFVANTNMLVLEGLKSQIDGAFINNATVTVTITDAGGNSQEGDGWPEFPLSMPFVEGSDGNYRVILSDEIPFVAQSQYEAHIHADGGMNRQGLWRFQITPMVRR